LQYSSHLSSTIDDFRNFFQSNKKKNKVTYNEIIDDALNIIEISIASKNIKILKFLDSTSIFDTYSNELKKVLLNILQNSKEALLQNNIKNPIIRIIIDENKLSIEDNAGGIPQNILHKIFDPYFSTKLENGVGLGLYMSKIIVEEHLDGKLQVENIKDGAKFNIKIANG